MFKSTRAQLWIVYAIVFFGFAGLSLPYLIFPTLFLNPTHSILPFEYTAAMRALLLGVTLSAYPFGQFLGSPVIGELSDDFGRKKVMTLSLLIAALFSLLTAFSLEWKSLWLLVASRFFTGLMEGNLAIARAIAADMKEIDKHETFGKINAVSSVSWVIGPLVGGVLSDSSVHQGLSLATPFYLTFTVFLMLSLLSFFGLQESTKTTVRVIRTLWQRFNFVSRLKKLFQIKKLKQLMLTFALFTLAVDLLYEFGPVYLTAIWFLSPASLVIYNGVLALSLTFGSGYLAGRVAAIYPNRQIVSMSIIGFSLTLIAVILATHPWMMLTIFVFMGFFIAVGTTNMTVQVSDAAPDEIQGEVLGVQMSLRFLGDALLCLVGGALFALSPAMVLLLACGFSLFSLAYYWRSI